MGKLFGRRGWFYLVAGRKAASIDGPCSYTLPPYNQYVSLSPAEPSKACEDIARALGDEVSVAVIDLNDLDRTALMAEVKRNPAKINLQTLARKAETLRKELAKYRMELGLGSAFQRREE